MILNPKKAKTPVVSQLRTGSLPHGDLDLSGVCIHASLNLDILVVKFDSKLTLEGHVHCFVSHVSQRFGILRLVKCIFLDICVTSLLLYICSPNPRVLFSSVGVRC